MHDIVTRTNPPSPWSEGDNIPWDEPAFSERMLAEHLDQGHDLASRRTEKIDQQVRWIHEAVLDERPTRILDLACGPGLYTSPLARLGHECVGLDFAPAAIAHAVEQAHISSLSCEYVQADVRTADFGEGFGLAMMLYGQFNVFRRPEAARILSRAYAALAAGGVLLLEPQAYEHVRRKDAQQTSWYAAEAGLFSDRPHMVLQEWFWDEGDQTSTERFHVIDAETGGVTQCALSSVAYTQSQLAKALAKVGFRDVRFHPSLIGVADDTVPWNFVVVGRK